MLESTRRFELGGASNKTDAFLRDEMLAEAATWTGVSEREHRPADGHSALSLRKSRLFWSRELEVAVVISCVSRDPLVGETAG